MMWVDSLGAYHYHVLFLSAGKILSEARNKSHLKFKTVNQKYQNMLQNDYNVTSGNVITIKAVIFGNG
jgi:DNA-binding transcriptional regulator WhiA